MKSLRSSKSRSRGFTLFETVVAMGVSVLAFAAIASMMLYGAKSTALLGNYADMTRDGRNTLDQMTTDIRQANKVLSCTNNQLQIQEVDISSGATNNLTYTYDSSAGTLTRIYSGNTNTLLTGITSNSLSFVMFQRNPVGGDITTNYVTTNLSECKIVQISWVTTRSVVGLGESENAQSEKIVIRKE